jgi:hypothetical protein
MTTLEIVIIAVVVVAALLAVGGVIARRRQLDRTQGSFSAHIAQINRELAAARAEDRGWEPDHVHAAAVAAYEEHHPQGNPGTLQLVQVVDRPGTDDDKAVFADGDGRRLTLGRRDGVWVFEALER